MKRIISVLLALILICSAGISAFAASVAPSTANATRDAAKTAFENTAKTKFDVNGTSSINAADARATLLASAGLSENGIDTSKMDADGDGMVTAIDARIILRISAQLDSVYNYMQAEKLDYFNAILNTAKPNNFEMYYNGSDYTKNVSYTDPKGVIKALDDGFKSVDSSINFAAELTGGAGEEIYDSKNTYVGSSHRANQRMMTIGSGNQSSYLTLSDIDNITYATNQSYTFTRYGTKKNAENTTIVDTSNVIYTETVSGLDKLSVYIKSDSNVYGAHAAKAFVVYDMASLQTDVKKIADTFNEMSMEMSDLYQIDFKVTPSVSENNVKYYNGRIDVYFNPADGKIVAAKYSIDTDYTVGLYMDVKIFMVAPYVNVDKEGQVNITNSTRITKDYYYIRNNTAHVDWQSK